MEPLGFVHTRPTNDRTDPTGHNHTRTGIEAHTGEDTPEPAPLVRSDITYTLRITCEVQATVTARATVRRSDVAAWLECDEADITQRDLEAYVTEFEYDDGTPVIDESMFELRSIDDWDGADVEVLSEERVSVVPESFVPLFTLEANPD